MAKQNFNYDKVYTAGWKDAMEVMEEKVKKEQELTDQLQTMVLLLIEKNKELSKKYLDISNRS
jgi:hypothetical protein